MSEPYYQDDHVTLYHGDMRELVGDFEADVVVTDPPYGETSLAWDHWPDGWPSLIPASIRSMWCFGSVRMFLKQRDESWKETGTRLARSVLYAQGMHRRAIHPTEKPAAILAPLIEYSVPAGGLVLDPFAGSGSTLLTARSLGRRAIGIEADEKYCEAAAKRLSIPDLFGGIA